MLVAAVAIIVLGVPVVRTSVEYVGIQSDEGMWEETEAAFELRQQHTLGGGSSYEPQNPFTLLGAITAPVTVLFRPFPWEAHNVQAMFASLESLLWLGLFWHRRRIFGARLHSSRGDPWVAFALVYSAIMIVALTIAANFGIIARQRTSLLPFLWILFA